MLYPKQQEIYKEIKDNFLLPAGTGSGKTIIALLYYLNNHLNKNLYIIAPAAKVNEGGWDRELRTLCLKYMVKMPKYKVVSYSSLEKYKSELHEGFYILDEAHYIKNPTAKRSKNIVSIIDNNPFLLLTATPGTRIEEFTNYFILWKLNKNKTDFYNNYIIQTVNNKFYGREFLEITGYKNEDIFNSLLKEHSTSRINVNDIVELPPMIHNYKYFKKTKDYVDVLNDRVIAINGELTPLDTQMKLCSVLRKIVSTKQKLEYLKYIKESLGEDNLLIFYNFNYERDLIVDAIGCDYIINGFVKNYPKKDSFNKIKGKVTLVQISAGGTGIELQYNSKVVYYSPTYSYQDYEQSLGRAYRPGQDKKVIVYKFKTLDTIEEDVWNALEQKEDFNEKLWESK